LEPSPTPLFDQTHLQPTGDKPVKGTSNRTSKAIADDRFDAFWAVYPKKEGKAEARKAWAKAITKAPADIIIERARRYADWLKDAPPGEFRPHAKHPQGWLNGERWNDAPLVAEPTRVNRFAKIAGG
jgi:hypothetical protein